MGSVSDVRIRIHSDEGAATIMGLAIIAVMASLLMTLLHVGAWSMARSHSAMVADIAAVSAARDGSCDAAVHAVQIHHVELVDCIWEAGDAVVVVRTPIPIRSPLLPVSSAEARARAGF